MSDRHERWCELADAQALGDPLDDEAQAFLRAHADDPAHADERAFYEELALLAEPEPVRADDRRRAELTLARVRAEATRRRVRRGSVAVLAVAAAVVLSWAVTVAWSPSRDLARIDRGGFVLAGDALAVGELVPDGEWVRATVTTCVALSGGRVCVEPDSEVRFDAGRVWLRTGALQVERGDLEVHAPGHDARLGEGEAIAIDDPRERAAAVPAVVEPVAVAPVDAAEATPQVATPQPEVPVPPAVERRVVRAAPVASAGEMLAAARALANAKATERALSAYEALRRAHPDSAEAHAANVSIGELQLRRRRFAAALSSFGRYLARGGALAEEARWGRVRALDGLGRTAARDSAIDQLLAAHPGSIYADEAASMRSR